MSNWIQVSCSTPITATCDTAQNVFQFPRIDIEATGEDHVLGSIPGSTH